MDLMGRGEGRYSGPLLSSRRFHQYHSPFIRPSLRESSSSKWVTAGEVQGGLGFEPKQDPRVFKAYANVVKGEDRSEGFTETSSASNQISCGGLNTSTDGEFLP